MSTHIKRILIWFTWMFFLYLLFASLWAYDSGKWMLRYIHGKGLVVYDVLKVLKEAELGEMDVMWETYGNMVEQSVLTLIDTVFLYIQVRTRIKELKVVSATCWKTHITSTTVQNQF